jgi:general secretion pathway protein G
LEVLTQRTDRFPDGILPKLPVDPWGRTYQYNSPGAGNLPYEVLCFGADGREGGQGAEADHSSAQLIHGEKP